MKRFLCRLIRRYQRHISPGLPPRCRFEPSCSHYALEAIETHGGAKGMALALWRVLRCNPLFPGGYDPVPPRKTQATHRSTRKETHSER